jgi:hypothetical protein
MTAHDPAGARSHAEPCTHSALECRERSVLSDTRVCAFKSIARLRAAAGSKVLVGAGACAACLAQRAGELRWNEVGLHLSVADSPTLIMIIAPVRI